MTDFTMPPSQAVEVKRYNLVSISLHWLMFILISASFILALILDVFPKSIKPFWLNVHFVMGSLVFGLLWLRLMWRLVMPPPPLPTTLHPHMIKATHVVHSLLYLLMAVIPLMGVMTAFFRGRGIDFGFILIASPFEADRATGKVFKEIHEILSWCLAILTFGHAGMALLHHHVLKDGLLLRMMPVKTPPR